jgi:transposase-like protein
MASPNGSAKEGIMSGTETTENAQGPEDLLTPEEREICGRVATTDAPHSQRALALMALDQGVTQAEAAQLSGLTTGQVRYWRDSFRQKRLGIFPGVAAAEARGCAQPTPSPERAPRPETVEAAGAGPSEGAGKTKARGGTKPAPEAKKKPKKKKTQDKKAKKKKKVKGGKGKSAKAEKKSKKKKKKAKRGKGKSGSKGGKKAKEKKTK